MGEFRSEADRLYAMYTGAIISNREADIARLRSLWLCAQKKELPDGELGGKYLNRIEALEARAERGLRESVEGTEEKAGSDLENKLMDMKFGFSKIIGGRNYTYRELSSGLRTDRFNRELSDALVEESFSLADNGLADLIALRNREARSRGFDDYWKMVNRNRSRDIGLFLYELEKALKDLPGEKCEKAAGTGERKDKIPLKDAVVFYCSIFFSESPLPMATLSLCTGDDAPPGPPSVLPLSYRPGVAGGHGAGHSISMDLPFVKNGNLKPVHLAPLFHELTHFFHFASVDCRGGYAFPPELADGNLLYESEALCFQNIMSAMWNRKPLKTDIEGLKDSVYMGRSEQLLYEKAPGTPKELKEFIAWRIREVYPHGGFTRTPAGASHLLIRSTAGRYWEYPAAALLGVSRALNLVNNGSRMKVPEIWKTGNEASWSSGFSLDIKDAVSSVTDYSGKGADISRFLLTAGSAERVKSRIGKAGLGLLIE